MSFFKKLKELKKVSFICTIFVILLTASFAYSQGTTGQISGTVNDPNGAVVPGAAVKATNLETNLVRETTTSDEGVYSFQLLPPGRYKLEIAASGFAAYEAEAVVNITQTTVVDANVSISGGNTTVTVEAVTPLVQTETAQNGRVITGETIRQLPLPTRNFQQILTLSPGAQANIANTTDLGRGDANISVNGQRSTSNSVRINGVDANSIGTNSTPNIAVPATDSLQEFIVQTSLYDASNGRNAGGNVEAITRSGTNNFNGSAYFFWRPNKLTSNDPFIKGRGIEKPELERKQYGGTLGGRIIRDRAFFFASYQGTREENGLSLTNSLTSPLIPAGLTDSNRTAAGLAAAFGITNPALISPIALNILNARLPNGQYAIPSSGVSGLSASTPVLTPQTGLSTFRENQANLNGDFNFTNNHNLSAKFFFASNPTNQANYSFAGLGNGERQLVGFGGDLDIIQKLYSITDTYIFSSNVVNQARFGYNRLRVTSVPEEPFTASQLGISSSLSSLFPGAPTITVAGLDSAFIFGSGTLADQNSEIDGYSFGDTLSITAGNHRIKIGGEYRRSTVDFYFNAFSRGQIIFPSFNAFLQGGSLGTTVSLLGSGVFDRVFKVQDWNGFVQDDWKISPRLSLNFGLRYDWFGLPAEKNGRLVNFIPNDRRLGAPPNGFVQAEGGQLNGVPTVEKTLVPVDKNNFSPRFGFSYLLDEELNIVMRGGYGIYYDRISTRYANTQLFNFPYYAIGVGLPGFNTTFANPFPAMPLPSAFPTAATIPSPLAGSLVSVSGVFIDPELKTPYLQQYNFGFQWNFARDYLFDVGYVGNKGTNLLQVILLNQPTFNTTTNMFNPAPLGAGFATNRNLTGGVHQIQTTSLSNYNSLQMSLTRRFSNGAQFLASYTYGKSIDYYSGAVTGVNELANINGDQYNWRLNRGRSDFNREHRFVVSGVYDLPKFENQNSFVRGVFGNWELAGIAVFQSGLPINIIDNPGNALTNRANYNRAFTGDFYTSGDVSERLNGYFNTAAFTRSAIGTPGFDPANPFGNTLRNLLTGPGQKNVDLSLIKFIPLTERLRGELRLEAFNIFNWVNYANPNNNISGAAFGQIQRASTGPRVLQLGFKMNF